MLGHNQINLLISYLKTLVRCFLCISISLTPIRISCSNSAVDISGVGLVFCLHFQLLLSFVFWIMDVMYSGLRSPFKCLLVLTFTLFIIFNLSVGSVWTVDLSSPRPLCILLELGVRSICINSLCFSVFCYGDIYVCVCVVVFLL